jgi:ribosomal protein L37E
MRLVRDNGDDEEDVEIDSDRHAVDVKANAEIVLVQCRHCGKTTWKESVSCEHCGYFVRLEDRSRWRPWWLIVGVVLGLLCVIRWILS